MTTILHLIPQLTLGGAARSLLASAKYSARLGAFTHRVVSLAPAEAAALDLARESGVEAVDNPTRSILFEEIGRADVLQVHWWNQALLQTVLHWELPPMRLMLWYHVAGDAAPHVITPELMRMADMNVATNPFTHRDVAAFRDLPGAVREERTAMIVDPADLARVAGVEARAHEGFNVGYIGTVDFTKMHPNFVALCAGVRVPQARFVVCGSGIEEELKAQARRLGALGRFDFRGYVHDLRPVLSILDVYGYPLCENTYASGELNLQESMAAGIPPVAFPHGGVRGLIQHEYTGLLVDSERAYQEAVEHLYHHPEERRRLGANAARYAAQMFGAENAARKLNPLYERLMLLPKRPRVWGVQSGVTLLRQPVSAEDFLDDGPEISGGRLFVESLGEQAGAFAASMSGVDLRKSLEADGAIAAASRLIQYSGVFAYRLVYPKDPWLAFWAALGALEQGNADGALPDFSTAIREGFPHWRVYWHFARAAHAARQPALAREALAMVLRNAPDFAEARQLLQTSGGHVPASEPVAPPSEATSESNFEECAVQAQARWQEGDLSGASQALRQALARRPGDPELLVALASVCIQMEDWPEALLQLNLAADQPGVEPEALLLRARVCLRMGLGRELEEALKRVLALDPPMPEALRFAAMWKHQAGQHLEAARICQRFLHLQPHDVEILFVLAQCLAALGETAAATLTAQEILKLDPTHTGAQALLPTPSDESDESDRSDRSDPPAPPHKADRPLVSVLISTCNAEDYLEACLRDLAAQTIADRCEWIVIDSGSEQNERGVVEKFRSHWPGKVHYLRTERESLYAAWNRGLELAQGRFITNANTDDAHFPQALERLAAALEAHPQADVAYADVIDTALPNAKPDNPRVIRRVAYPPLHPADALFFCPLGCHPMWRRTVFERVGPFDPTYQGPGDYELLLRLIHSGGAAVHVRETLSLFYKNPRGLSRMSARRTQQEHERLLQRYRAEMPIERLFKLDSDDPAQVALGWTALGLRAARHDVPWFDNPQQDLRFAKQCFETALRADPRCEPAIHNLLVTLTLQGQGQACEGLLRDLPASYRTVLKNYKDSGQFAWQTVDLEPALPAFEFGGVEKNPGRAADAEVDCDQGTIPADRWPVRWIGSFLADSAAGADARAFFEALTGEWPLGIYEQPGPEGSDLRAALNESRLEELRRARERFGLVAGGVAVVHAAGQTLTRVENARHQIARVHTLADRLPRSWVTICNQMDELWVPDAFQADVYRACGVEADKVQMVPTPVNERAFNPCGIEPWELPGSARINFLAEFEWTSRAGWEVLLTAYWRAFRAGDDVCLFLHGRRGADGEPIPEAFLRERLQRLRQSLQLAEEDLPRVELLEPVPEADRPRLFLSVHAVMAPARGEGEARLQREAMMMGRPVLGTAWGGFAEHLIEEHSWPLPFDLVPVNHVEPELFHCRAGRWAEPQVDAWVACLQDIARRPEQLPHKGARARAYALRHFSQDAVRPLIQKRFEAIRRFWTEPAAPPTPSLPGATLDAPPAADRPGGSPVEVAWEGAFLDLGSLALVNRELTRRLQGRADLRVVCVGRNDLKGTPVMSELKEAAQRLRPRPSRSVDITVRHAWPPQWDPPESGDWVLIQPWEYGALPESWVSRLAGVREVWVPSVAARRAYVDSGVDPDKVHVVPNGVDPDRFHPGAPPMTLPTSKGYKFLFVGGTIARKGPDALLEEYANAFTAQDDVCLVIKDFGGGGVYAGQTLEARIRDVQRRPNAPEILHLTEDLAGDRLPGLYTACDSLVHPYRGEGFALPVLEAMACGLPVAVTAGGATDDFADDRHAYRLASVRRVFGSEIGGERLVRPGWMLEPDRRALRDRLRWLAAHREEARAFGAEASRYVRRHWTWERAAAIAADRLHRLRDARREEARCDRSRRGRRSDPLALPAAALAGDLRPSRALLDQGRLEEAWSGACDALRSRPYHPEAFLLLATLAQAAGAKGPAKRLAQKARDLAPDWKPCRKFLKSPPPPGRAGSWQPPDLEALLAPAQPRLTVCLIARNEERFIGQCLESIRDVAAQIVVVDTGSTDWTVTIAQRFGAEVLNAPWQDDFSAARNAALERATGDWILMIDADEELEAAGRESLMKAMNDPRAIAWRLPMVDRGREGEGCGYVPRLFRNAPGLFYVGRIHEQVFSSVEVRRAQWGLTNGLGEARLIHHGYAADVIRSRDKIRRNLALLERAIEELPNEPNLLLNYGLELVRTGHVDEGLEQYREAFEILSIATPGERVPELVESLLSQMATHLMARRDYAGITRVLGSPLAVEHGLTASLLFALGLAWLELRRPDQALPQFQQCLATRTKPCLSPINPEILKAGPAHCLALCHAALRHPKEAQAAFLLALQDDPNSRDVRMDWCGYLADSLDRPVDALKVLQALVADSPGEAAAWIRGGTIALSRPEFAPFAADWTGEAVKWFPHHPVLAEQRAEALLQQGLTREALPWWRQAAVPGQASHTAAKVLCEAAQGERLSVEPAFEPAVSQEFLRRYRRLIGAGAADAVFAINRTLPQWSVSLPTAAHVLTQALAEARREAV